RPEFRLAGTDVIHQVAGQTAGRLQGGRVVPLLRRGDQAVQEERELVGVHAPEGLLRGPDGRVGDAQVAGRLLRPLPSGEDGARLLLQVAVARLSAGPGRRFEPLARLLADPVPGAGLPA